MEQYTSTRILSRAQFIPVFIPESSSLRVFKKIYGDSWIELDRVDLMEGSSPDSYSYDDNIYTILFNPALIGNTLNIQYDHNNVPNPGIVDLLPTIIAEQSLYNYNCILSGLYALNSYVDGSIPCGTTTSLSLMGGLISISGLLYSMGTTYWDLNKFGAQSGDDIVTSTLFYITDMGLSDHQKMTKFIQTPLYTKTTQYNFDDGGGIASSLTELNNYIQKYLADHTTNSFIEIMRLVVVSHKAPQDAEIFTHYEPKFRRQPTL